MGSAPQGVPATDREPAMKSKIVFAALSLAVALGSSSAIAGGKKPVADPRATYLSSSEKTPRPNGRQNFCDVDPNCNGWAAAEKLAQQGKLKF
jgi:hypothetical protein